ncbi:alpha/beta fold hydrolase [Pseudoalteromonas sp. SSDWG2]|uniref:alpha/beta fold hydrolase n=1 Tax=Pseudoalteromonas sp. SSDWG2 TaxID=3139391 RepID=UPI003BA9CA12
MSLSYPISHPNKVYHLAVGQGHQLEIEEHGNPDGLPVIICHGGPGAGLSRFECGHFNPQHYRILLYSQRGCGNSTPHSCNNNTLDLLIHDLEAIRAHLGIERWVLCGESFGATLVLCYALRYQQRVAALMLWATFLASAQDSYWYLGRNGAGAQFYPEQYQQFNPQLLNVSELIESYRQRLFCGNELTNIDAAKTWCAWEDILSQERATDFKLKATASRVQRAQLQVHYFYHQFFIEDNYLMSHAHKLTHIPIWMVHGRHDLVSAFARAQALATKLNAHLDSVDGLGHSLANEVYCQAQCRATDHMFLKLKRLQCKG